MEVKGGLFEILSKIKARPGLYIGRPSLSDLFMFLVGYKTARRELGIEPTAEEIRFYQEFHQFVENKSLCSIKTIPGRANEFPFSFFLLIFK